jgi:hypothetical protein
MNFNDKSKELLIQELKNLWVKCDEFENLDYNKQSGTVMSGSEKKYQAFFGNMLTGTFIKSSDGKVITINPAKAMFPLHSGHQDLGLLQFNNHHPGRFTTGLIVNFEIIADSLAIALSNCQAVKGISIA